MVVFSALTAVAAVSGLAVPATAPGHNSAAERVVVRRTAHGVPHIAASSFRGLGYGYAYTFARDNICTIAEDPCSACSDF
jgi:acyl-homoserine-lactone acylase